MNRLKLIVLAVTGLWLVTALLVSLYWMGQEYALIEKDNGDGTVTFRDGPEKATSTKDEFFAVAVKNSLAIVLFFPTLPYVVFMFLVGVYWLITRKRNQREELKGEATSDGRTMEERRARMRDNSHRHK